ncbi:NAD(P)-binding protein [Hypoxylon rubiginosum]|uniref:NAD(P)-binding protein n=1 Tax=Hypoxylon rubiginosum TaxID=110542 RepID=A0ACC0CM22_9PEZI|nr:NAD(P)-binding protein [Hypoxylon rubiginosum]
MAESTTPVARPQPKTAFVTGANGYIGFAVCRAFVRAGYRVFGLVRRLESATNLVAEEIIPIIGSISKDATFLDDLSKYTKTVDVIVSCTEQIPFEEHFEGILSFVQKLATTSNQNGVKPLVLASSGCKDYGTTDVHGAPGLAPHTEESPLQPTMEILHGRTYRSLELLEYTSLFDAAVIRPTPLFGYDSSYYGFAFEEAAAAAKTPESALKLHLDFNTILHGCHVDDCAEAYLALAQHPDRGAVAGECFNISGYRYETLADLAKALAAEYGLRGGVVPASAGDRALPFADLALGYSQWVDSSKIRRLTGWTDKRMLLAENLHVYRVAYEEAARKGHEGVLRVKERIAGALAGARK